MSVEHYVRRTVCPKNIIAVEQDGGISRNLMISDLWFNEPMVHVTYGSSELKTWYHIFRSSEQNFCSGDLKY